MPRIKPKVFVFVHQGKVRYATGLHAAGMGLYAGFFDPSSIGGPYAFKPHEETKDKWPDFLQGDLDKKLEELNAD